ncbi:MAG: hypothetical protein AAB152_10285 [Candidatus Coatesbacteria bacterium]
MKRVSVVFTEHAENGLCNSSELLAILMRINPEVIFLEAPAAALGTYFNRGRMNLEGTAVSRYREKHRVDLIPVDLPTPEAAFFENFGEVIDRVGRAGPEYDQIAGTHRHYVSVYGFAYLNSEYCSDLFSKRYAAILTAIGKLADPRLAENYDLWIKTNERRDAAMMENIRKHCRQASFSNYAFLVGAAHRQSIMSLSRSEEGPGASEIPWDFSGFLERPVT